MTCAKRRVICILSDDFGRVAVGENTCNKPQKVCPRLPGEGYEKCKSVCEQDSHAEVEAIEMWQMRYPSYKPTHALVRGHNYVCDHCKIALGKAGARRVSLDDCDLGATT